MLHLAVDTMHLGLCMSDFLSTVLAWIVLLTVYKGTGGDLGGGVG